MTKTKSINIRVKPSLMEKINLFKQENIDKPNTTESVVELINMGLQLYEIKKQSSDDNKASSKDIMAEILLSSNKSLALACLNLNFSFDAEKSTSDTAITAREDAYLKAVKRTEVFLNGEKLEDD